MLFSCKVSKLEPTQFTTDKDVQITVLNSYYKENKFFITYRIINLSEKQVYLSEYLFQYPKHAIFDISGENIEASKYIQITMDGHSNLLDICPRDTLLLEIEGKFLNFYPLINNNTYVVNIMFDTAQGITQWIDTLYYKGHPK